MRASAAYSAKKEECLIKKYDFKYKVIHGEGKKITRSYGAFKYYYHVVSYDCEYDGTALIYWPDSMSYSRKELEYHLTKEQDFLTKKTELAKKLCREAKHNVPLTMDDVEVLKQKARQVIPGRVEHYAELMNTTCSKISIRCQTSIWGSCTPKTHSLSFNAMLMLLPDEVVDTLVCHELAHIFVGKHSPEFWQTVEKVYPDYRKWEDWLDEYGWWYLKIYPEKIRQHRVSKS